MPPLGQFEVRWEPRDITLLPIAVAARGEVALKLARRLLKQTDEELGRLEGVAGKRLVVVRSDSVHLPWIDGVQYLGVDAAAPAILLPTNYRPTLPPPLLAQALAATANGAGTIALLAHPLLLVPLKNSRPICRETLASWLERQ